MTATDEERRAYAERERKQNKGTSDIEASKAKWPAGAKRVNRAGDYEPVEDHDMADAFKRQVEKVADRWGFDASEIQEGEPEEPAAPVDETTSYEKRMHSYQEIGMSDEDAERMTTEDMVRMEKDAIDNVDTPIVSEIDSSNVDLLKRIAHLQKTPTEHFVELNALMAEARARSLLI